MFLWLWIDTETYLNQADLARAYPNLFRLLWQSTLPCYPPPTSPNTDSVHMLRQCLWQGEEGNCSEIFTPVITDSGVCCAFNLESDLKESNYSHLVEEMQVKELSGSAVKSFTAFLAQTFDWAFFFEILFLFYTSPRERQGHPSQSKWGEWVQD